MKKRWIDIRTGKEIDRVDRYNYGYLKGSHFRRKNLGGDYKETETAQEAKRCQGL